MTILPLDPAETRDPRGLQVFLERVRAQVRAEQSPRLVSISLEVDALDPLAVLESIFEPDEKHFYLERPAEDFALAGAEAVMAFTASGADRFAQCQRFIDETLARAIAVGAAGVPFGGPHFFTAFTFESEDGGPEAAFPAASVFVPRWQVATRGGRSVAVANIRVDAETDAAAVAERIWRAHGKFRAFDYLETKAGAAAVRLVPASDPAEEAHYLAAVTQALSDIAQGDYEKVVLARQRVLARANPTATQHGLDALTILNALRQRFTDCFAFSVGNGRGQSFIGASPERLLQVRGGRLRTEALAGSARRGAGASEDAGMAAALQRDEKELREHRLVLESIVQELRALGLDPAYPARPGLRRFANVQHLHSAIEAPLGAGVRVLDVAARLHPTPAVGGWPRDRAVGRIPALEGFRRGLYAGALGWIDCRGDGEMIVGLRSALVEGGSARLYAGAGIVAGSDPKRELAETELKFRAVQEAIG